jgi:2-keto-3-deoxy-L-rhamnonate aldolase RhmA
MDKYQRLAQKLQNRDKVLGFTIQLLNNPLFIPSINREDLDFVLFDAEHGIFDAQNAAGVFQVCRLLGLPALYRVQDSYYHLIAKAIDIGADGVMIPRTETLEQLRTAVDALLFYPDGRKGFGGH